MKWLEREQYSLHREKTTKTNLYENFGTAAHGLCGSIFLQIYKKCDTMSIMECESDENKNFIKTIYTLLQKL